MKKECKARIHITVSILFIYLQVFCYVYKIRRKKENDMTIIDIIF